MCVILDLKKGENLKYSDFENAVFNNPHGFGIIMKANGMMEVRHELQDPEKVDPEALYKILYDNSDAERIVHLRWKTEGDISESNLHPFLVHKVGKSETWFAHNGTLHSYSPARYVQGQPVVNAESDTYIFNKTFLQPLFLNFRMEDGHVNLNNEWLRKMITKEWSQASRGIIVNNRQESFKLGTWEEREGEDGALISVSNKSYFDKLSRGPRYDAQKKAEEEARRAALPVMPASNVVSINRGASVSRMDCSRFGLSYGLSARIKDLWSDSDIHSLEGLSKVSALTYEETKELVEKHPRDAVSLITMLSARLRECWDLYQGAKK